MQMHANNRMKQFQLLLPRITRADQRSAILSTLDDFLKILSDCSKPNEDDCRLVQISFLDKIQPSLFAQITESEFDDLFGRIFLKSPSPSNSLTTLIQFISSIQPGELFKFNKTLELFESVQIDLLNRALLVPDDSSGATPEHFSFILCSFSTRLYNFLGQANEQAAIVIARFEANLLTSMLQTLELSQTEQVNDGLIAHILADYNTTSPELISRFLASTWNNAHFEGILQRIFTFKEMKERKRQDLLLTAIKLADDGGVLKTIFGNSVTSDKLLCNCLVNKSHLLPSFVKMRNSKKSADYLALLGQSELLSAFMELLQLFADNCRIMEFVSLHSQFQLSLAIFDFAENMSPEKRKEVYAEVTNLLVPIVPEILQQTDCSRRQLGMFLAETVFTLFECPSAPKFDYVAEDPVLQEFILIVKERREGGKMAASGIDNRRDEMGEEAGPAKTIDPSGKSAASRSRVAILDSDDDEDGQELPPEAGPSREQAEFVYLRDCLDSLREEKEDRRRWEAALKSIPALIQRKAVGLDVLAVELVETTLLMENRFNVQNFKTIQADILRLLLVFRPELVSQMARLYGSRQCSMAHRFTILSAIVQAAKSLAGEGNGTAGKIELVEKDESKERKSQENGERKGPKVTWRSGLLASQALCEPARENAFARVLPQFAFPLLELCTRTKFETRDVLLMGRTIWALSEVISCGRNSPSIVRVSSATFPWLRLVRQQQGGGGGNPFVLANVVLCYLVIANSMPNDLLREHFSEELAELLGWMVELGESADDNVGTNESLGHSIHLLSAKLADIFSFE